MLTLSEKFYILEVVFDKGVDGIDVESLSESLSIPSDLISDFVKGSDVFRRLSKTKKYTIVISLRNVRLIDLKSVIRNDHEKKKKRRVWFVISVNFLFSFFLVMVFSIDSI